MLTKKPDTFASGFYRTRSRGRTGTTVKLLVFETNASTNSAIRAHLEPGCKCI
jgi:hypothetical protein